MPTGTVLFGSNNIFTVAVDTQVQTTVRCRLKGKKLILPEREYNPLAPGDQVRFELPQRGEAAALHEAVITERLARTNAVARYNPKRAAMQTIAANVTTVVAVTSARWPPFRARFTDRVSIMANRTNVPMILVINKVDLGLPDRVEQFQTVYESAGHRVFRVSAERGHGIDALRAALSGTRAVLVGRSGVGKSRLINALLEQQIQRVSAISAKYGQGRHTTTIATLLRAGDLGIIDTPGLRELDLGDVDPSVIRAAYPEFDPFEPRCSFSDCRHLDEPGCAVVAAVEATAVMEERYENYRALLLRAIESE